jgi:hypothetical protein
MSNARICVHAAFPTGAACSDVVMVAKCTSYGALQGEATALCVTMAYIVATRGMWAGFKRNALNHPLVRSAQALQVRQVQARSL